MPVHVGEYVVSSLKAPTPVMAAPPGFVVITPSVPLMLIPLSPNCVFLGGTI